MADVTGDQDLPLRFSEEEELAVGQRARRQRRVDEDLVFSFLEAEELVMRQAETPLLPVIGGPIRDQVRLVRERKEVRSQLRKRELCKIGRASCRERV